MSYTSQPNLIFVLSDQHNPGVAGYAGDPIIDTPHIDSLAETGTVLSNCYCGSPLCVPSRAALLTGRLPSDTGIYNNFQALRSDDPTFVHSLAASGYDTVLAGRMHFIGPDQRHGYQQRLVGDITKSFAGREERERIYGPLVGTPGQTRLAVENSGAGQSAVLEYDRTVLEAAQALLESRRSTAPLFMTVGFFGPHCPYVCPEELFDKYYRLLPKIDPPGPHYRETVHPAIQKWYANRPGIDTVTAEDIHRVRSAYYGMVEFMDRLVGELLTTVRSTIGMENTVIVYASDHGDNVGANGLFWKTNFYEGAARVPVVFSAPGLIEQNRDIDALTSLLDLGPTFTGLCNTIPLPDVNGFNLAPVLTGEQEPDPDRIVISQLADLKGDNASAMIRWQDWKFVAHSGYDTVQLFNLRDDRDELKDLGRSESHVEVRSRLSNELSKYWDGETAFRQQETAKKRVRLLEEYTKRTRLEGYDEWFPTRDVESVNYLTRRTTES